MKIVIFAHSGTSGGAEHALRHLVRLLSARHEIHVVLPSAEGGEAAYYTAHGIPCYLLPMPLALPHFSAAMLQFSVTDFERIADSLRGHGFDLAISNTIAILHGGLLASLLGIPHLTYAHEILEDAEWGAELLPGALHPPAYLRLIEEISAGVLSCSHAVAGQFGAEERASLEVLAPFDYDRPSLPRASVTSTEVIVQVIGTQSRRKMVHFAVTVIKALLLRGIVARLDIVGTAGAATGKLSRVLEKRKIPFRLMPHCADPCALNLSDRVVTLICSASEPYGLTVPESLRLGVPVLATRSGGPSELLPEAMLYDVGDLNACVRKLERLLDDYPAAVHEAETLYSALQGRTSTEALRDRLDATFAAATCVFDPKHRPALFSRIAALEGVTDPGIGLAEISSNIAHVQGTGLMSAETVLATIELDKAQPGTATGIDIRGFDVVPFADSPQMAELYTQGLGLAIELAATHDDPGRLQMAAFILCALQSLQQDLERPIKVLALGDGIGIDTLRLARAGFSVDYMDYDKSAMASIAARNFTSAQASLGGGLDTTVVEQVSQEYDAVVCLEVIEHVPAPLDFAAVLFGALRADGLLFISECFNGIETRWPTHLLPNERLAGLLPFILLDHFRYSRHK